MDLQSARAELDQYASALSRQLEPDHADLRQGLKPPAVLPPLPDARERLDALTERVRHDMEILSYPKDPWVLPRIGPNGAHVYDVAIVGGGQCGLTLAFGLRRERVDNVIVLDGAPRGREGPWTTYSRMWTLRSPKHVTGPDLGIPSLAPRSWYEAVFGEAGWQALDKWPRQAWQAYLDWYRQALDLPVRNDARVTAFADADGLVELTINGQESLWARKVVLATGLEGMGDWYVPPFLRDKLPAGAYTLCTADVDSFDWRNRKIAVLGAGATAWDRAADLLELGAASVTMYMRRGQILTANPFRYTEKAGFLRHYASMSDADKWRWMRTIFTFGQPPTQDGVDRCAAFDNFTLHVGASWQDARMLAGAIEVTATDGTVETFDHLFIGCGFSMDPRNRPELAAFADNIATWADVYTPPEEMADPWLMTYPYLDRDLSFVERTPGKTPVLNNIYCFNYGATASNAHSGASLSGLRYGIEPLLHGITYALWVDDEPMHFDTIRAWCDVDTDPSPLATHLRHGPGQGASRTEHPAFRPTLRRVRSDQS
ncbi:MAG: NAD(P)/FAD-dependent oxidoreductase [Ancalomicrobiaceae bacterium]|nr:NAD(P)/FAD-dependent oxidoreductase [Ancalomicrobiaceae bacterium]